jgi:flagellar hook protein FlgE
MMRSLWAGVSGLQAHQIALDVEGNNIANVNTAGFKYSRASFADLLSQTQKIATAPQGTLGGKNPMQVGLGTQVNAITKIFKQGSVQTTDKNTDLAIQGDGFFIVSPDGGKTYKFSRNGDFTFDADGNFVDNNGYIIQGWVRDSDTGEIDATAPIQDLNVAPGLTTPAEKTSYIDLKANLNSGMEIENKSPIYTLDPNHYAYDFDEDNNVLDGGNTGNGTDGLDDDPAPGDGTADEDYVNENSPSKINLNEDGTIIERSEDMGVLFNDGGEAFNLQNGQGIHIGFTSARVTSTNAITGLAPIPQDSLTINGVTVPSSAIPAGPAADVANTLASAINAVSSKTGVSAEVNATNNIILTNDNTDDIKNIEVTSTSAANGFVNTDDNAPMKKFIYSDGTVQSIGWSNTAPSDSDIYYFRTSEDLRHGMQQLARDLSVDGGAADENATEIQINSLGQFQITMPDDGDGSTDSMRITVDGYSDSTNNISENSLFTAAFNSIQGYMPEGDNTMKISQGIYAATHASSVDIFDSLGTKHTVRIEFRKTGYTQEGGTEWKFFINVPSPSEINTVEPKNMVEGVMTFNDDGSLSSYTPASLNFTANNGSAPNQNVTLNFGTSNQFDGVTSFDSQSNTSGISQNGFPGGDLSGIRIDETGTLIGSFTNGRSFGLARVAMAKFTNNEGLESDGGNVYIQTSNSGDPIIGQASTGGRGFVQASALEMSNVDLSRSLTQLIVVQRGYQANTKTITTSDQILNTLLQLKQ